MPNAKIFAQACGRVKALVKQYDSIRAKPRPTNIDDSQPLQSELSRLQRLAELMRADCGIIRVLPEKIMPVTVEWYQAIGELEDEMAFAAANLEYENCRAETEWDDVSTINCGELALLLLQAYGAAEHHAEALAVKLAEAETSRSAGNNGESQGGKGNVQANNAGSSSAGGSRPANNAGGFSGAWNPWPVQSSTTPQATRRQLTPSNPWPVHSPTTPQATRRQLTSWNPWPEQSPSTPHSSRRQLAPRSPSSGHTTLSFTQGKANSSSNANQGSSGTYLKKLREDREKADQLTHAKFGPSTRATKSPPSLILAHSASSSSVATINDAGQQGRQESYPANNAEARHKEPDNVSVATPSQKQLSKSEVSHFPCAFCKHHGHTATHCLNYGTLEKRLLRAARQGVCVSCCSVQPEPHLWKTCPHEPLVCSFCKHRGHHQAFCRAWLRIFTSRISRRQPQTNTRKNPTRGRSPSSCAKAVWSTTAKPRAPKAGIRSNKSPPCRQFRCTCHRQDCNYVVPLPWNTTDARTGAEVTEILQATRSLTVGAKEDIARDLQAASSQPLPSPARQGWTAGRGGARSSPRRQATNNVAGVSASLGLAANNAAGILGGCGRTATALPSRNAADGLEAMMCSEPTSDYDPCGQCRSCSGPLHVGADGKPFIGATRVVPPDFDVAPACHIRLRPLRRSHYPRIPLPRLRRVKRQHYRQENTTRGGGGAAKYRAGTPELDSDDPTGPNPRLSEEDQRALEAALDSDNESCASNGCHPPTERTYGSAYATTPYARPLSPSGGFGPFTGHENETPEDYASTAGEEYDWPDEPTSTATLTPYSTGCGSAHEPVPLLDPGTSAQQTSRGAVYEDHAFEDDLHDDRFYGGVPHDDRFYGNDVYGDHAHDTDLYGEADYGGDFYDEDSVRWA